MAIPTASVDIWESNLKKQNDFKIKKNILRSSNKIKMKQMKSYSKYYVFMNEMFIMI